MKMIACMGVNRALGFRGELPWHIPKELKYYKAMTLGKVIIMGRRTFESLPGKKPLPNRHNIVITSKMCSIENYKRLEEAAVLYPDAFIIGGERLFSEGFKYTTTLYLTVLQDSYLADTFFPEIPPMFTLQAVFKDELFIRETWVRSDPDVSNKYYNYY
ncbi:FolA Dihydrofolate reductase [uncultured Caudovirales phage]|uniref:dihydrofolate reductase n=1 Tax=uncultured Caudovirales phage TaxID=2100421 RepID=A0A6J5KW89_9CAUD|nr:FolA Dihydrofolate reductase [uncultured Caudovirales phage]